MTNKGGQTKKAKRAALVRRYEYACVYCNTPVNEDTCTIDHIIPRKDGGTYNYENLVPACYKCNQRRGHMDFLEFITVDCRDKMPDAMWDHLHAKYKAIREAHKAYAKS